MVLSRAIRLMSLLTRSTIPWLVVSLCEAATLPLIVGVWWLLSFVFVLDGVCCFDVVETSYEGHMVDALASRADEGRWSLR